MDTSAQDDPAQREDPATSGWFDSPVARRLLAQERLLLDRALPEVFGFYTLQIGAWGGADRALRLARTQERVLVTANGAAPGPLQVRAGGGRLPFADESVDGIVLPHTLERSENPHQLLRECQRILVPEGRLYILGFNPWSLWGLRRKLDRHRFPVGTRRMLSLRRLEDWLELLELEVDTVQRYGFRPPLGNARWQTRLRWMERRGPRLWPRLSGAYLLACRKRVAALRMATPSWRRARELVRPAPEAVANRGLQRR